MLATMSTMGHTQPRRHSQFLMPQKVLDVLTLMPTRKTKTRSGLDLAVGAWACGLQIIHTVCTQTPMIIQT